MKKFIFLEKKVFPVKKIIFTAVSLEDWVLVKVSGQEKKQYLQSQITADMSLLNSNKYFFCGHCNEKGKVYSTLLLFKRQKNYFYILRKSVVKKQIQAIKKYSLFSNTKFSQEKKLFYLGVLGKKSRYYLKKIFIVLPDEKNFVIHEHDTTIIWIKGIIERFILISSYTFLRNFLKKFSNELYLNNSRQWLSVDIEEKIPVIDSQNLLNFFPQEINLNKFQNGISFIKGCYLGQEQISKIKYRKINKRTLKFLYCLHPKNIFSPGDFIYIQVQKDWIRKGILLSSMIMNNNIIYAQAVLNKFYIKEKFYKIKDSYFFLKR
ncbi:tRNA-modifying protein YgfZ [Buchnera aphidicola]|uniref:tRNA-modifying protein YgfZ n=1 Tax=Buchnera aphidicola TaxID=9 RepID=UPI003463ED30